MVSVELGNIVEYATDAIVNAANASLLGGGGVDGAIHYAAGPELKRECILLGGCDVGGAKITKGYNLAARHVIHTVGPVWKGGNHGEVELLARCYRGGLGLAIEHNLATLAFRSISTGAYRFPIKKAAPIALTTINTVLKQETCIEKITVVCYDALTYKTYLALMEL